MAQVLLDGRCIQNGKYDGAQRYAEEVIKKLDELVEPGKYELLIFEGNENLIQLENITKIIVKPNTFNKKCWATYKYLDHGKKLYVGFANEVVLDRNSIVTIHDIYAFYGVYNNSFYYYFKKKIKAIVDALFASKIVTVSQYSKQTMIEKLPVKAEKIQVIYNGWQHLIGKSAYYDVLKKYDICEKKYYLYLGRLVKNKNIDWIFRIADKNPGDIFLIAGALSNEQFEKYYGKAQNIIYTGYVPDEELRSLYKNCKAFLFPSLMEGFGIPPMEALYHGAPIIISNTSSLPEIYGNSAHYIDPYCYDYNLDELLNESVENPDKILKKFSWEKSAREWYALIEECLKNKN